MIIFIRNVRQQVRRSWPLLKKEVHNRLCVISHFMIVESIPSLLRGRQSAFAYPSRTLATSLRSGTSLSSACCDTFEPLFCFFGLEPSKVARNTLNRQSANIQLTVPGGTMAMTSLRLRQRTTALGLSLLCWSRESACRHVYLNGASDGFTCKAAKVFRFVA